MATLSHTAADPIHGLIRLSAGEYEVANSRPFRRLRNIHQLALAHLVYPGATHCRFEHSLGVMGVASRVFDVVTDPAHLSDQMRSLLPEVASRQRRSYWRRVVRMAALCHDLGHLPFSHAAEKDILPAGWKHEQLSRALILDDELGGIFDSLKLLRMDVVKCALGPREAADLSFSPWEKIVAEIIVGDAFGADRIDYLLRDPYRAGVGCPRFDADRLIEALRILPCGAAATPALGMLAGGLRPAEGLTLARHYMYTQIYFHRVLCTYDVHFRDFLRQWLPSGKYCTAVGDHLAMSDREVTRAIVDAAHDQRAPGHEPARRLTGGGHFPLLYQRRPEDRQLNPQPGRAVYQAAQRQFGAENVRWECQAKKPGTLDFPVKTPAGGVISSTALSRLLARRPVASCDYVFVHPRLCDKARRWLDAHRESILACRA
jgi:hypothetical protein